MTTQRITMPINDLGSGDSGALLIERAVARTPGVIAAYVNPSTEMAYIIFDGTRCTEHEVIAAVTACGFHTEHNHNESRRPTNTTQPHTMDKRLKLAELTSSMGAGVLGAGLALLLPTVIATYALSLLILGGLMHGWGMFDKHRLENTVGHHRPWWSEALYWGCWIALFGLVIIAVSNSV